MQNPGNLRREGWPEAPPTTTTSSVWNEKEEGSREAGWWPVWKTSFLQNTVQLSGNKAIGMAQSDSLRLERLQS